MEKRRVVTWLVALALSSILVMGGCGGSSSEFSDDFTTPTLIDNAYLPLVPGTTYIYEGETDEGTETIEVTVSHLTRKVQGVRSAIVVDRAYLDGELVEETFDWYAQDDEGNVWYMGEDSAEYDSGVLVSTDGSWEAGIDGAQAGYIMLADPQVGDEYQQEYYEGEAEDMAEVLALDAPVTLSDASTYTSLKVYEWTPLDPTAMENKYYAPGVGLVLEEQFDGSDPIELISISSDMMPDIGPSDFSTPLVIDNIYFPLVPGTTYSYESDTEDGFEEIIVEVLNDTRVVMGITCRVVRDRVYLDGDIIEDTYDWYAQDDEGNVWYMGEEVDNYDYSGGGPPVITHEGSWEAGEDVDSLGVTAYPGIVMKAEPRVGDSYHQEYYEGAAEDIGAVMDSDVTATVAGTVFFGCLKTQDINPFEPDAPEYKYYAPNIGLVLEEVLDEDFEVEEVVELISMTP